LEEFKKSIDSIKDVTHFLWLFLAGEPFLNPHFCEMVAYATKNNLHTTTSSNALLIDKQKAQDIVKAGLDNLI
jgi:MoaA/NifB/PqqE/SkfB family radical SAM enzyme